MNNFINATNVGQNYQNGKLYLIEYYNHSEEETNNVYENCYLKSISFLPDIVD